MEEGQASPVGGTSVVSKVIFAILGLYVVFSLYFTYSLSQRIDQIEAHQQATESTLGKKIAEAKNEVKSASDTLSQEVGLTKKEIAARSAELSRQQKATDARLTEEQQKAAAQIGEVSGALTSVKTDVGGVKTDVASTRSDLEATKAKLNSALGDLGVQSGLIATTREELDFLKHRGDRNYFEFSLLKGKSPTPVSTVSLLLKKVDAKKGKFTMNVVADDHTIEKKDRNVNEPIQFYTGREKML